MILNDTILRQGIIEKFDTYKDCVVLEEFMTASCNVRADIVAVNGHIHGYEIKSDVDSLKRLVNQVKEYDHSFEMNTIIVGQKFKHIIENHVPDHWGIIVSSKKRALSYSFIRKAKLNPNLDMVHMSHLLKKSEAYKFAREHKYLYEKYQFQIDSLSKADKYQLLSIVPYLNRLETVTLKKYIRDTLKKRKEETTS